MKVLVAGGTGFIGAVLVRELTARGHDVSVLARSPAGTDLPPGVDRIALDLTSADTERVQEALAGHDAVVNLVALSPLFTPPGQNEEYLSEVLVAFDKRGYARVTPPKPYGGMNESNHQLVISV